MTTEWTDLPTLQDVAKAQADGMEIEVTTKFDGRKEWDGKTWNSVWKFRARPRQPKMKKVKMLCWYDGAFLHWIRDGFENHAMKHRIPAQDIEIEIPEGG